MRNIIRVLWTGIAIAQLAVVGVQAATTYQLDNGSISFQLNASDGTEPLDNWFANEYTALTNANLITQVNFGVFTTAANSVADVVIYQQGSLGFNRVYTQAFTPLTGNGTNAYIQQIPLTTPVKLDVGANFLVAVFIQNVIALSPNDKYPYLFDTSGVATGTFWDRSAPNTFNLDNLSGAVPINQNIAGGTWNPGAGHVFIRAIGTTVPEPSVFALGGLAALGATFLGWRRRSVR